MLLKSLKAVSIPQAVSAVATLNVLTVITRVLSFRFNTASGKCCCNLIISFFLFYAYMFQYRKR